MRSVLNDRWAERENRESPLFLRPVDLALDNVEARWIDLKDKVASWPVSAWLAAKFRTGALVSLHLVSLAGWWASDKAGHLRRRFPLVDRFEACIRRRALSGFQNAAQAYTSMSWVHVAALTALLLAGIATVDLMLGYLVSFRLLYVLPIWLAARLGGAGAGTFAMLMVGALLTYTDSQLEVGPQSSFAMDFAVRWIGLGGFLLTVLHVEGALRHARQQATHDPLTGLANRTTIESLAKAAIDACTGEPDCLHVAVADCDRFKLLNDQGGHAFGDHALKVLARRLQAIVRDAGTVGRIGGDEFIVLFQGVDRNQAGAIMEKANQAFRQVMASLDADSSISFGIATLGPDGKDFGELCRTADERMFARKRTRQAAIWVADHTYDRRAS